MSEQNKALVQQAYDSFRAGRIDKLLSLISKDISWSSPEVKGVPFGGKKNGLAAVGAFFVLINDLEESLLFETSALIAADKQGRGTWQLQLARPINQAKV